MIVVSGGLGHVCEDAGAGYITRTRHVCGAVGDRVSGFYARDTLFSVVGSRWDQRGTLYSVKGLLRHFGGECAQVK